MVTSTRRTKRQKNGLGQVLIEFQRQKVRYDTATAMQRQQRKPLYEFYKGSESLTSAGGAGSMSDMFSAATSVLISSDGSLSGSSFITILALLLRGFVCFVLTMSVGVSYASPFFFDSFFVLRCCFSSVTDVTLMSVLLSSFDFLLHAFLGGGGASSVLDLDAFFLGVTADTD